MKPLKKLFSTALSLSLSGIYLAACQLPVHVNTKQLARPEFRTSSMSVSKIGPYQLVTPQNVLVASSLSELYKKLDDYESHFKIQNAPNSFRYPITSCIDSNTQADSFVTPEFLKPISVEVSDQPSLQLNKDFFEGTYGTLTPEQIDVIQNTPYIFLRITTRSKINHVSMKGMDFWIYAAPHPNFFNVFESADSNEYSTVNPNTENPVDFHVETPCDQDPESYHYSKHLYKEPVTFETHINLAGNDELSQLDTANPASGSSYGYFLWRDVNGRAFGDFAGSFRDPFESAGVSPYTQIYLEPSNNYSYNERLEANYNGINHPNVGEGDHTLYVQGVYQLETRGWKNFRADNGPIQQYSSEEHLNVWTYLDENENRQIAGTCLGKYTFLKLDSLTESVLATNVDGSSPIFYPAFGSNNPDYNDTMTCQQVASEPYAVNFSWPYEETPDDDSGNGGSGGEDKDDDKDKNLYLQISNPYFSPNEDGVKDSVQVNVVDTEGRPWELLLKKNGQILKTWTDVGNKAISWDGKTENGDVFSEGKYNFIVRTVEKRDRVRDREQVVLDLNPFSIEKLYAKQASGNVVITGKIKKSNYNNRLNPDDFALFLSDGNQVSGELNYQHPNFSFSFPSSALPESVTASKAYHIEARDLAGNKASADGDSTAPNSILKKARVLSDLSLEIVLKVTDKEAEVLQEQLELDLAASGLEVLEQKISYDNNQITILITDYNIDFSTNTNRGSQGGFQTQSATGSSNAVLVSNAVALSSHIPLPLFLSQEKITAQDIVNELFDAYYNSSKRAKSFAWQAAEMAYGQVESLLAGGITKVPKKVLRLYLNLANLIGFETDLGTYFVNGLECLTTYRGGTYTTQHAREEFHKKMLKGIEEHVGLYDLAGSFLVYNVESNQNLDLQTNELKAGFKQGARECYLKSVFADMQNDGPGSQNRLSQSLLLLMLSGAFTETVIPGLNVSHVDVAKNSILLLPPSLDYATNRKNIKEQTEDTNPKFRLTFTNAIYALDPPEGLTMLPYSTLVVGENKDGPDVMFVDSNNVAFAGREVKNVIGNDASKHVLSLLNAMNNRLNKPTKAGQPEYKPQYQELLFQIEPGRPVYGDTDLFFFGSRSKNDAIILYNQLPKQYRKVKLVARDTSGKIVRTASLHNILGIPE